MTENINDEIVLGDFYEATYDPKDLENLRPELRTLVGSRTRFYAHSVVEEGDDAGSWLMQPQEASFERAELYIVPISELLQVYRCIDAEQQQ